MQRRRAMAFVNPANYYLLAGLAILVASVYVPVLSAERSARLEERADRTANALLEAALQFPLGIGPDDVPVVLARFFALAERDGVFVADVEVLDQALPGTLLTLRSKHYAYHLAESPPEVPSTHRDLVPAYEAVAWPLSLLGPARSVFFVPDDGPRAYTRNLVASYQGLQARPPKPGHSHRRSGQLFDQQQNYRSRDDERWILY